LADLGDKRVYLCDIPKLLRLPVWERQRVYRPDRAKGIAMDKIRKKASSGSPLSFPGVISLYEKAWEAAPERSDLAAAERGDNGDDAGSSLVEGEGSGSGVSAAQASVQAQLLALARSRFGIVDGQHRVGALRVLFGKGEFEGTRVLIEVFPLANEEQVSELFIEINKAEPVKDVDLPGMASDFERETLFRVAETLKAAYPEMFKDSTKCRKPHLNLDNLRDAVFSRGVVARHGFVDESELLEWLLNENYELAELSDEAWFAKESFGGKKPPGPAFQKALAKARSFRFYLGLNDDWLDN